MARFPRTVLALAAIPLFAAACAGTTVTRERGPGAAPVEPIAITTPDPAGDPAEPDPGAIDRAALRDQLAQRRATNLQRLRAYSAAASFPRNTYAPGLLNVLIDEDGRICAAANLIALDGNLDIVRAQAGEDNFIALADVTGGPLHEWILTSGLTREEIALIQEPYFYEGNIGEPDLADFRAAEIERLQAHFDQLFQVLDASTDASLDVAVAQLAARPALVASLQ